MADDQALQGQPSHLANGSRGRSQILPYQPHAFTGYEPNRPASMPSTPRRLGEAPGPPRVNPPASGSGTQAPAQVWRMLREVVHLHRRDEEASRERFVYEQQEAYNAAAQREHQHTELEEIAGSLRAEITIQSEQHLNHYLQQEQACFTSHLRNVESHLQAVCQRWQIPVFTSSKSILCEPQRLRREQQHRSMLMLLCIGSSWSKEINSRPIKLT